MEERVSSTTEHGSTKHRPAKRRSNHANNHRGRKESENVSAESHQCQGKKELIWMAE